MGTPPTTPATPVVDDYNTTEAVDPKLPQMDILASRGKSVAGAREVHRKDRDGNELMPIFVVGEKAQDTGAKKVPSIYVNCEVGPKDFKKFRSLPLHEIPLVRRLHRDAAGDVTIFSTDYAPGLRQVRWMSQQEAHDEYRRLAGDSDPQDPRPALYMLPSRGTEPSRNVFSMVYGESRDGAERFFRALRDMAIAWMKLVQRIQGGHVCTPEDIWEVVDIADPRMVISTIEMPDLPDVKGFNAAMEEAPKAASTERSVTVPPPAPSKAETAPEGVPSPEETMLLQYLLNEQVPDAIARPFAHEVALAKGNPLTEEAWARVLGKASAKTKPMRDALTAHYEAFLHPAIPH